MKQATWLLTAPSVNSTLVGALTDKGKKAEVKELPRPDNPYCAVSGPQHDHTT